MAAKAKAGALAAAGAAAAAAMAGLTKPPSTMSSRRSSTAEAAQGSGGGMSVGALSAALLAELRGLEDRIEVMGGEEGPAVALMLGAALEAIRGDPFRSI